MILINHAIYGQGSDQGHSFLRSSYSTDSLPAQFSGYTDLVDRPQSGILSGPIVRGFIIKDHFLLVKSFPDAGGRSGRVFSHALIISINDYLKLKDISDLLKFHLTEINKDFFPQTINYSNNPIPIIKEPDEKMNLATYKLINHIENKNTIAWVTENGFWKWISMIWSQIPPDVKRNIRIGNAFNTKYVNVNQLNLLIISEEIKPNWLIDNFAIIDNQLNRNNIPTDSLRDYILGFDIANSNLNKLLKELKPKIKEIDDLKLFNKYAELFSNLKNTHSFRDLFLLVDLVSKYNDDFNSSLLGKNKLIKALAETTIGANTAEFFSLRYQSWKGYDPIFVNQKMGDAIDGWLEKNLLNDNGDIGKSTIVVTAIYKEKEHLLFTRIKIFLTERLNKWQKKYQTIIWEWLRFNNSPIKDIIALLPDNAQNDLLDSLPILDKKISQVLMTVLKKKGWFTLLSMVAIQALPSREAFEMVLSINTDIDRSILKKMSDYIDPDKFLKDVCSINNQHLILIAIEKLKTNPSLKQNQDINDVVWQKIWAESSKSGLNLWEGLTNPGRCLNNLLDIINEGNSVDVILLKEVSRSHLNSLKEYQSRSVIWPKLPTECKKQFLENTLIDCLKEIDQSSKSISELEKPLKDSLEHSEILTFIVSTTDLTIDIKLSILETLLSFTEAWAITLIDRNTFTKVSSHKLGIIVNNKSWKNVAKYIFSRRNNRIDLEQALVNCNHLLNILDKFSFSLAGKRKDQFSKDDFWMALFEKAVILYPEGPNENGLWERSGGDRSDLISYGTGKEKWNRAISFVKNGGSPNKNKLMEMMIEDYSHDEILKKLKKLL